MYTRVYIYMYIMYTPTCIHTGIHTYIHQHLHRQVAHACLQAQIHTQTHTHTLVCIVPLIFCLLSIHQVNACQCLIVRIHIFSRLIVIFGLVAGVVGMLRSRLAHACVTCNAESGSKATFREDLTLKAQPNTSSRRNHR